MSKEVSTELMALIERSAVYTNLDQAAYPIQDAIDPDNITDTGGIASLWFNYPNADEEAYARMTYEERVQTLKEYAIHQMSWIEDAAQEAWV